MDLVPAQRATAPLPAPRVPVHVRPATANDLSFIDGLQGKHTRQVGWMPKAQLEGKIKLGHVIVAEDEHKQPVGFCIGNDQYFKRDDCGIIYQLCVSPGLRRSLIGAMLVKAMFDRAAWGCRLFSCWCAQDIEANRFWESLGFVPLAFRAGSRTKGKGGTPRIHIFWQKRIREADTTTPWWFPSETKGGSIREDRLVLPIPPDTHWSQVKPVVLPGPDEQPQPRNKRQKVPAAPARAIRPANVPPGGVWWALPAPPSVKPEPKPKPARKNDPKLISAARELRDRYLEAVNADPSLLLPQGKYALARSLPDSAAPQLALPLAA